MLQAAGPDLTPQNMARGLHALPTLGAPLFQYGAWSWNTSPAGTAGGGDHTAQDDARFVYWNGGATSAVNGKKGTFVAIFNGKRFTLGQWPKTLPKLFTTPGSAPVAGETYAPSGVGAHRNPAGAPARAQRRVADLRQLPGLRREMNSSTALG